MTSLVTLDDYERAAQPAFSPAAWAYVNGGAADEFTLRRNRDAFNAIQLAPRMLNDVSNIDLRTRVLGADLSHPIMLAPVAAHSLAHVDAEVGTALGARAAKAGIVLSSYTSRTVEQVAATGVSPLWFQLYMQERSVTQELVAKVVDRGCSAICITVDTPNAGPRDRQARAGFDFPEGLPYRTVTPGDNPCTWKDVEWIQGAVKVPVILKGILHPEDANLAVKNGAAAIVVSNHGGRNLDTAPASIDALPRIVDRVGGKIPVLFDGGIRRGTDVLKALAFGATAVMIGRPYVYGLAVAGAAGVTAVVDILRTELEQAMALCGVRKLAGITRELIWTEGR
jgi:4-hydroxymandelate oxidase